MPHSGKTSRQKKSSKSRSILRYFFIEEPTTILPDVSSTRNDYPDCPYCCRQGCKRFICANRDTCPQYDCKWQ